MDANEDGDDVDDADDDAAKDEDENKNQRTQSDDWRMQVKAGVEAGQGRAKGQLFFSFATWSFIKSPSIIKQQKQKWNKREEAKTEESQSKSESRAMEATVLTDIEYIAR